MSLRLDKAWIVAIGCLSATLCAGLVMWSFGVFFSAIQADLGGSRGDVSSVYTVLIASNAASWMLTGRLSDKGHSGLVLQTSAVLGGIAIALCSRAQDLTQLALLLVLVGAAAGGIGPLTLSIVQRVFQGRKRAGLALAIVSSGIGLGAQIFAPSLNYVILASGWRHALLAASIAFFSLMMLAWVAVRHGGASRLKEAARPAATATASTQSVSRFVLSGAYVSLAAITVVALTTHHVLTVHLVPYAMDVGTTQTVAAFGLGLIGGLSVPGRLGCGMMADASGWARAVRIALVGAGLSVLLLPLARQDWILIALVALFGFCHGARAVGVIGLIGHVFRMHSVGHLIGTIVGGGQLVSALGPYIAGRLHDVTGSYTALFVALGVALMLLSFAVPRSRSSRAAVS